MHDRNGIESEELGARRRALLADLVREGLPGERRMARGPVRRRSHDGAVFDAPRNDAELRERIERRVGRMVSHPRAIGIDVHDGVVRLSGRVLTQERDGLLRHVQDMAGVRSLVNAMSAHEDPREIASRAPARSGTA
jgi:hypothetical protein